MIGPHREASLTYKADVAVVAQGAYAASRLAMLPHKITLETLQPTTTGIPDRRHAERVSRRLGAPSRSAFRVRVCVSEHFKRLCSALKRAIGFSSATNTTTSRKRHPARSMIDFRGGNELLVRVASAL